MTHISSVNVSDFFSMCDINSISSYILYFIDEEKWIVFDFSWGCKNIGRATSKSRAREDMERNKVP